MAYINGKEILFSPILNYGFEEGKQEGYEEGRKAEKQQFWDYFFNYGKRRDFRGAFGSCFDGNTLKDIPYTITPIIDFVGHSPAENVFYYTNLDNANGADISHIKFDFSRLCEKVPNATPSLSNLFVNAKIDNIYLDLTGIKSVNQLFNYANCGRDPMNITLKVTETLTTYTNPFYYLEMPAGVKIIFTDDSVIAGSIAFPQTKSLTAESAKSVINALKNYVGTENELVKKLTFPSTVWERLNSAEAPPSENTWQEYVNVVKGWATA